MEEQKTGYSDQPPAYNELPQQGGKSQYALPRVAVGGGGFGLPHSSGISQQAQCTNVVVVRQLQLGLGPTQIRCSRCQAEVVTNVSQEVSQEGCCFAICLCILCWPLAWIPCCMDSFRNSVHTCPNCNALAGIHRN